MMTLEIEHLADRGRFQTRVEGALCVADYRLAEGVMAITHTEVARHLEGRGIAGELVQAALDHARDAGLKVRPLCSFSRAYMKRHPESQSLLG